MPLSWVRGGWGLRRKGGGEGTGSARTKKKINEEMSREEGEEKNGH